MNEPTPWDRLRLQFKPDSKGRFKTLDAIEIAKQIDKERIQLKTELEQLKKQFGVK